MTAGTNPTSRFRRRWALWLVGAVLLVAGAIPSMAVNAANLELLRLATTAGAESSVPFVIRRMPFMAVFRRTRVEAAWISARYARLLEAAGHPSPGVGCEWDLDACTVQDGTTRPSDTAHADLARAFVAGDIMARSPLEAELLATSCLQAAAQPAAGSLTDACRAKMAVQWPDLVPLLEPQGLMVGRYVDDVTRISADRLSRVAGSDPVSCERGRSFIRAWIQTGGVQGSQLPAARALDAACGPAIELSFYRARAADMAGEPGEARFAYEAAQQGGYPEPAYWHADFLVRQGDCAEAAAAVARVADASSAIGSGAALRTALAKRCGGGTTGSASSAACGRATRVFRASDLLARFENGEPLPRNSLVTDDAASGREARRATRFGTVIAFGPYVTLPYGRYRAGFFIKTGQAAPNGLVARVDVREDTDRWRPTLDSWIVRSTQAPPGHYVRIDRDFTATGSGVVSFAVLTLTANPVWFDRIELRPEGCF